MSGASSNGIDLLKRESVAEFNKWRISNLTLKLDISGQDFLGKNLEGAFLNGVVANGTSFANANLSGSNLVQAELNSANFEGANLERALLMYTEIKGANFANANLTLTNFMWANAQDANFTGSKFFKTIMVESLLQNAKVPADSSGAFLKYAKLDGTSWALQGKDSAPH